MTNNDILRRLRYAFEYNDKKMIGIFAHANSTVNGKQITSWLKKDDVEGYVELTDTELAVFLNGLIIEKRGKKDGPQPTPEKRLNNNLILTKLKIALNLKAEDIVDMLKAVDFNISKGELSAFFRKPDHKHYRQCKAQFLRNFVMAIQKKYRKSPAPKAKADKVQKHTHKPEKRLSDDVIQAKRNNEARPNASKRYDNPNAKKAKAEAPPAPKRKVLKLKPEQIWNTTKSED